MTYAFSILDDTFDVDPDRLPMINNFAAANIAPFVPIGTVISGVHIFVYQVLNNDQVAGSMTLIQNGDNTLSEEVNPNALMIAVNIRSKTFGSPPDTEVFKLRGVSLSNQTFEQTYVISSSSFNPSLMPALSDLAIMGVNAVNDAPFTLTGEQTFTYTVTHPDQFDGMLRLIQGTNELSNEVDPNETSIAVTIQDINLAANSLIDFALIGLTLGGEEVRTDLILSTTGTDTTRLPSIENVMIAGLLVPEVEVGTVFDQDNFNILRYQFVNPDQVQDNSARLVITHNFIELVNIPLDPTLRMVTLPFGTTNTSAFTFAMGDDLIFTVSGNNLAGVAFASAVYFVQAIDPVSTALPVISNLELGSATQTFTSERNRVGTGELFDGTSPWNLRFTLTDVDLVQGTLTLVQDGQTLVSNIMPSASVNINVTPPETRLMASETTIFNVVGVTVADLVFSAQLYIEAVSAVDGPVLPTTFANQARPINWPTFPRHPDGTFAIQNGTFVEGTHNVTFNLDRADLYTNLTLNFLVNFRVGGVDRIQIANDIDPHIRSYTFNVTRILADVNIYFSFGVELRGAIPNTSEMFTVNQIIPITN